MLDEASLIQIVSEEDRAAVKHILQSFDTPETDRNALTALANAPATLALEKKYVPRLNQDDLPVSVCEVLVCTVGLRPAPVILTTLMLKPKALYLFHSPDSRRHAEAVRDDPDMHGLGLDPDRDIHLAEISLTNAPQNYEALRSTVERAPNKQIVVDISGGVKVMGVSLAAAAFWQRLPVVYLLGEEIKGIIKPFSEALKLLQNPYDYFGDTEFKLLKGFFDTHNYDAALNICITLRDTVGDVSRLGMLDILEAFIRLYRDWDAFIHSQWEDVADRRLATRLRRLLDQMGRFDLSLAPLDQLRLNLQFLQQIERSWQPNQRDQSDLHRLVDIFCAAQRRAKAGKYDDAIARLYRCLEMSATILLVRDWAIGHPKKPDFKALQEAAGGEAALREKFRKIAGYELSNERLGLDAQMALLAVGGKHPTAAGVYKSMSSGQEDLMEHRNRSTLAHGTVPATELIYRRFCEKSRIIVEAVASKSLMADLIQQAAHPELTI